VTDRETSRLPIGEPELDKLRVRAEDSRRWDLWEERRDCLAELARRAPALAWARQELLQAQTVLGLYEEAFATGEALLDAGECGFDMRLFWYPMPGREVDKFRAAHMKALRDLEDGPMAPWVAYYRGLLERGLEGSRHWLGRSELFTGRYAWMNVMIGRFLALQGDWEPAAERLELGAAAAGMRDWRAYTCLAEVHLCLGRKAAARRALTRAVACAESDFQRGEALAWRGEIRLWLGDYEAAIEDLAKAETLGSSYAQTWKAGGLVKLGRLDEALAELDAVVDHGPVDGETYLWRAEAKRLMGRRDEALEDLAKTPPGWFWAGVNRALAHAGAGRDAEAVREAAALSQEVTAPLRVAAGLPASGPLDWRGWKKTLESAVGASRGYRRDEYRQAVWLPRAEGAESKKEVACSSRTSSRRSATRR